MITAEEIILYLIPDAKNLMTVRQFKNAVNSVKKYTKEAIKADRINLLEHVTATLYRSENDERFDDAVVDEDSLLNAPNIELK